MCEKTLNQKEAYKTPTCKRMYPVGVGPQVLCLDSIFAATKGHTLRLIVSSRGAVAYGVARELASILRPFVGQSLHIKTPRTFWNKLQTYSLKKESASLPMI